MAGEVVAAIHGERKAELTDDGVKLNLICGAVTWEGVVDVRAFSLH